MWVWIKKNIRGIITAILTVALCIFLYSCESQVKSLTGSGVLINRAELQLELDRFMSIAQLRMLDLDKQDAFRNLVIENSLVLVQGQPFSVLGFITGVAGIYGATHAATKSTKYVSKAIKNKKVNNG